MPQLPQHSTGGPVFAKNVCEETDAGFEELAVEDHLRNVIRRTGRCGDAREAEHDLMRRVLEHDHEERGVLQEMQTLLR